jgi:hypothetical protein
MYLNNAYHYYAPEPGPAYLIWFCIHYEPDSDGSPNWRWVKVPDFDAQGRPLRPDGHRLWPKTEYTRRLTLAEYMSSPGFDSGLPPPDRRNRRTQAGSLVGIPLHDGMGIESQYRPPNKIALRWTEAAVRHVARTYRHENKPELAVRSVQVYRVVHTIAFPWQIAEGWDPYDPIMYYPFYQGEFEPGGTPIYRYFDKDGRPEPDSFLYWLIPIVREDKRAQETPAPGGPHRMPGPPKGEVKNYVLVHAGVEDEGIIP